MKKLLQFEKFLLWHMFLCKTVKGFSRFRIKILEEFQKAIEEEQICLLALEELIENEEFDVISKRDAIKAKMDIHVAEKQENTAIHSLIQSIERIEDALELFGAEIETSYITELIMKYNIQEQ